MTEPSGATAAAAAPPRRTNFEDAMRDLDRVPLFMRDLPADSGEDGMQNTAIEALQSLAYDGSPEENAENFKNQGNEYFRAKRYREALGFYQQGLDARPEDAQLRESLLLNSAQCNLELKNYGRALHNARDALIANPASIKALYRAARGFFALDRMRDALGCCDLALERNPENIEIVHLRERVRERAAALERFETERAERRRRKKLDDEALKVAFLARGLWIQTSEDPPDNPTPAHFDPEALPPYASADIPLIGAPEPWRAPDPIRTPVIFPVMLLYPQHSTSDLISEYQEDTPIGLHLQHMFPPEARGSLPWDTKGEYVAPNLSVIVRTHKGRLLRIGHKLSLREAMDLGAKDSASGRPEDRDGMILRDGIVDLYVLPRGSDAEKEWIAKAKAGAAA